MTNREVAVLGFKLVGLWLMAMAAIGIAALPYYWASSLNEVKAAVVIAALLPQLVALGIGVPVWFSAESFASRIFPGSASEPLRFDRLRAQPIFALALAIIGVFLLCEALPALVRAAALFVQSRHVPTSLLTGDEWPGQTASLWSQTAKANAAEAVARLAIGLAFLIGPARLGAGFARFRREMQGSLTQDEPGAKAGSDGPGADGAATRQRDDQ
jgi:hypothetical protein